MITNEFCGGRKNSKTASVQAPYPKAYASCSFEKFPAQPQASLVHTSASSSLRGTSSLFSSSALQSSLQSSSLSSSSSSTLSAKRETIDVNQVRECFLRVWVKLLLNYRDFLTPCPSSSSSSLSPSANKTKVKGEDRVKKRKNDNSNSNNDIGNRTLGGDGRPAELFRSEAYLAHFSGTSNKSNQIRTFMRDILETQVCRCVCITCKVCVCF